MSQAKISYFSLSGLQGKDAKLDWVAGTRFEEIRFENISPDGKGNWINLTDNDFDSFLPLVDKEVKAGRSEEAVFKIFSAGVKTQRDEWVYDFSRDALIEKAKYLVDGYMQKFTLGTKREFDIKWDRETTKYLQRNISKIFKETQIIESTYRPYVSQYLFFDRHFNGRTYQLFDCFDANSGKFDNSLITLSVGQRAEFSSLAINSLPTLDIYIPNTAQCLPLYRYDEKGDRIENITDWALERFREHYLSTQARGLSPLFPTDLSSEQARGLSPLLTAVVEDRQLWFVTFVTHNSRISERMVTYGVQVGEPLIFADEDQIFIAEKIAEASKRYEIAIAAFNVLPDHVHMVIAAETEKELNANIRKIKGFSSHEFQRSRNFDKGQNVWAQKFNRQPIQDENALTDILEYVLNNHIKHSERWGQELISTWENGLPEQGLKSISEIVESCSNPRTRGLSPLSNMDESEGTRGLSPLSDMDESEGTRGLSPLSDMDEPLGTRGLSPLSETITKLDIFHYTYAVLHNPAYRTKYELNLKREFPRLPFYEDFHQWASWGKSLMDLHLNYETIEPYGLQRVEIASKDNPKAKLKADKTNGVISLDENTQLIGVEVIAWEYKLGNRSALEWILDQYKEKKPKDPTIAKLFNTYKFADYKEQVIDLLQRVCTVSVKTMAIVQQMSDIS